MTVTRVSGALVATAVALSQMVAAARPVHAQPDAGGATARGIYVTGTRLGVSAEIELDRDGKRSIVPPDFEFRSGDRFRLHVTANRDSYVYVLNRTVTGNGAASRGIKVLADADRKATAPAADTYVLVYPTGKAAPPLVRKGIPTVVPAPGLSFSMDEVPGAEKLLVLASDGPLSLSSYFDPSSGRLLGSTSRNDSVSAVLNRLNDELLQMADNADTDPAVGSRSITVIDKPSPSASARNQPPPGPSPSPAPGRTGAPSAKPAPPQPPSKPGPTSTVGVPKTPGKPLLLELTLAHLAR